MQNGLRSPLVMSQSRSSSLFLGGGGTPLKEETHEDDHHVVEFFRKNEITYANIGSTEDDTGNNNTINSSNDDDDDDETIGESSLMSLNEPSFHGNDDIVIPPVAVELFPSPVASLSSSITASGESSVATMKDINNCKEEDDEGESLPVLSSSSKNLILNDLKLDDDNNNNNNTNNNKAQLSVSLDETSLSSESEDDDNNNNKKNKNDENLNQPDTICSTKEEVVEEDGFTENYDEHQAGVESQDNEFVVNRGMNDLPSSTNLLDEPDSSFLKPQEEEEEEEEEEANEEDDHEEYNEIIPSSITSSEIITSSMNLEGGIMEEPMQPPFMKQEEEEEEEQQQTLPLSPRSLLTQESAHILGIFLSYLWISFLYAFHVRASTQS